MNRNALLTFLLLLTMAPVPSVGAGSARADIIERVIATVNDEAIFLSELRRRALPFLERIMAEPSEEMRMGALRQLYDELLERLVDEALFEQAASRMQVRVSTRDVERAVENVIRQNGLTREEFWQAVQSQGYTEAQYRSDLRRQLLRLKVVNQRVRGRVNITEADVRRVYDDRVRSANRRARFHVSQIFLPMPDGASATDVAELRTQGETIRSEVTVDSFAQAMELHGGGELGWLSQGDLPEALENALMALDTEEISAPIQTPRGIHIFLVHERQQGGANIPDFATMRDQLYQEMLGGQMERQERTFILELRREALISRRL